MLGKLRADGEAINPYNRVITKPDAPTAALQDLDA
jgi:hypothetical protein